MNRMITLAALFAALYAVPAAAQEPATTPGTTPGTTAAAPSANEVAPEKVEVLLDNDQVRVSKFKAKAGDQVPMHHHPDHLAYALKPCTMQLKTPDGKTQDVELKPGKTAFMETADHATTVKGKGCELLVIELKDSDDSQGATTTPDSTPESTTKPTETP